MKNTNIPYFEELDIFRFNRMRRHHGWTDRVMRTWAINFAEQGDIWWGPDGQPIRLLRGPIAFWTWPGPRWYYGTDDTKGWHHRFISFTGERTVRWQQQGLMPQREPGDAWLPITDPKRFRIQFDSCLDLLATLPVDQSVLIHQLEGLLLSLHRQPAMSEQAPRLQAGVQALMERVSRDPQATWDFAEEADRLGCTAVHLRRLWKERTGLPPGQDLQRRRLALAAQHLREHDLSLATIAEMVGLGSHSYLSRLFTRAYGVAPGAYRQQSRKM